MIWCVNAATGIAVLEPSATDVVVLLHDCVADAELFELHRQGEARNTGADDDHMALGG
jgi:hypothetical protein